MSEKRFLAGAGVAGMMVVAVGAWAQAGAAGGAGARVVDLEGFPADFVDEVIVPVPSEVFSVMDKLGRPDWKGELQAREIAALTDRFGVALQFGVVVADGFIAVQAGDRQMVQNLGQDVRRLAEQLGLRDPVLKHAQSIIDGASEGDFDSVREELDRTQRTVREEMARLRDEELAQCVSLGGWVRGTEAITAIIAKDYSTEQAELLFQPDLVEHFQQAIAGMEEPARESATMRAVAEGLRAISGAMRPDDEGAIPAEAVSEIHRVCTSLVAAMVTGEVARTEGGGS